MQWHGTAFYDRLFSFEWGDAFSRLEPLPDFPYMHAL
jgi:hypothetical protein